MDRPVPLPPGLSVLPPAVQGVACTDCQRLGARWARATEAGQESVCARCVLYESAWGQEVAARLELLVLARETARGRREFRDARGRLLDLTVMDLLLAAIVLPYRLATRGLVS